MDPDRIAALLYAAAARGEALTYAEVLNAIGFAFSRPKMRALCVALDAIDAGERGAGRPCLAVLVVRASDRLPGQGWWLGQAGYAGLFTGADAARWVAARQAEAFAWWAAAPPPASGRGAGSVRGCSR